MFLELTLKAIVVMVIPFLFALLVPLLFFVRCYLGRAVS